MKKLLLFGLALVFGNLLNAQVGIFGGTSIYKSAYVKGFYTGLQLGAEVPRDDMVSFFGRVTATLPQVSIDTIRLEAIDPTTTFPSVINAEAKFKNSVVNFQFGTRYYLGNGYDYGLSAYGGSIFEISALTVKRTTTESYDETKYQFVSPDAPPQPYSQRGSVFLVNLGLSAGVKYNFYFGLVYFDVTGSYNLFPVFTNALSRDYGRASAINFTMNLGFRKDIF
jgi:hypothetical protein